MNPGQFDVVLTPNLYGTIATNIGTGLVGGPGVVAGANLGNRVAMFEPGARHTGRDIVGQNKANPTAMILASAHMPRHMDMGKYADKIETALISIYAEDSEKTTVDVGGSATTTEFTLKMIQKIQGLSE